MELTKVGDITPPLNSGQVTISIGTNPKDAKDGYFYFNTGIAPTLIDFKTLLAEADTKDLTVFIPFYKDKIKKFNQIIELAETLSDKKHLKIYARVLEKINLFKSGKISEVKTYSDIISNKTNNSKSIYNKANKQSLVDMGIEPAWSNYTGHFVGTLVAPICLTQDKASIEESSLSEKITQLLAEQSITLMAPAEFLREANWVVTEAGISLQSDGGADFTEVVLGMLNSSGAAFSKMVKEGDGSAASLAPLGINTDTLGAAASNHTGCGATGEEKVKNAFIALENIEISDETTETNKVAADPVAVKKEVKELITQLKKLDLKSNPHKALKGLSLLHSMITSIEKLEDTPSDLEKLKQSLEKQKEGIKPLFSKQISRRFDKGIEQLEELPTINSSKEVKTIFNPILKMYKKGWRVFLPKSKHPQKEKIERVDKEVNVLEEYEQKIVPLREQHEKMEDSEEKSQLTNEINALIDEARAALA